MKSLEPHAIIGSYVAQLCRERPEFWSRLELDYHHFSGDSETHEPMPLSILENLLRALIQSYDRVFLFLSELSECSDPSQVLRLLQKIAGDCPNLIICITSLQDSQVDDIMKDSPGTLTLSLTPDFMAPHIRQYIESKLESSPKLRNLDVQMKTSIAETLLANANGM